MPALLATREAHLGEAHLGGAGLGFAIVDPPTDFNPVICGANSEPMIVETVVVQLGKQIVRKAAVSTNLVELKSIATCVAKFAVFCDE